MKAAEAPDKEIECSHEGVATGEKCSDCEAVVSMEEAPPPLGGAKTFSDIDQYRKGQEIDSHVSDLQWQFSQIVRNIWNDDGMPLSEKADAIQLASSELASRATELPEGFKETGEKGIVEKAMDWLFGRKAVPFRDDPNGSWATFFKDDEGNWRWLAIVTNKFIDRHGEIFTEASHKEFEAYLDKTGNYPELRLWHVPGSGVGQADFWTYADGFVVSSGTFYKEAADVAASLAAETEPIAISHGYRYPELLKRDGVYEAYRSFEVTILPAQRASNVWTAIGLKDKEAWMLNPAKRTFLVKHLGEGRTAVLEKGIERLNEELTDAGVAFKDFLEGEKADEEEAATSGQEGNGDGDGGESSSEAGAEGAEAEGAGDGDGGDGDSGEGDGDGDGEGEGEKASGELTLESIEGAIKRLIEPIQEAVGVLQTSVKELQSTDEEKMAKALAPKGGAGDEGQRPSQTNGKKESELPEEVQAILDKAGTKEAPSGAPSGEAPAASYVKDWLLGGAGSKEQAAAAE